MCAVGDGRLEAARELVLSAGARLEEREAAANRVLDRVIEAHVEVQKAPLLARSPVAAIERTGSEQIESAAERIARRALARDHDVQGLRHALEDLLEKGAVQVLPSPEV